MTESTSAEIYAKIYRRMAAGEISHMFPAESLIRIVKLNGLPEIFSKQPKALDFGCGEGRHAAYLEELGFHVHATDVSAEAIDCAKTRTGIRHAVFQKIADADEITESGFSLIVAWEVLHWLGSEARFLKSMDKLSGSMSQESPAAMVFTMPAENHYLLQYATEVAPFTYRTHHPDRDGAVLFAPPLEYLRRVIQTHARRPPIKVQIHHYQHGRETVGDLVAMSPNLRHPFSMYAFYVEA